MTNINEHHTDFRSSALLIFLYSLQGMIIGLLLETLHLKLKSDFSYSDLGIYLMCSYPFSLKIFWSPIVDAYYIKSVGRRKTWVILTQTISVLILIYLGKHIDELLFEKKIYSLSVIALLLMFIISTQDIAVDGWALTLCKENCSQASSCQTIGQVVGVFISTSVYINLHYYNIIELSTYFYSLSIVFIIATAVIVFIKEVVEENETLGLIETLKSVKKIFINKNIRTFVTIIIFSQIGTIFFSKISTLVLIEKGLSQELITNVSMLLIPVELGSSYYFSKTNTDLLKNYLSGYRGLIFTAMAEIMFLSFFTYFGYYQQVAFIFIMGVVKTYLSLMCFNGISGFFYKICDNKIGATYITALNSCNNLAQKWPNLMIFSLVDYIGFQTVGVLSIIYSIIFFASFSSRMRRLDVLDKSEWIIKDCYEEKENK